MKHIITTALTTLIAITISAAPASASERPADYSDSRDPESGKRGREDTDAPTCPRGQVVVYAQAPDAETGKRGRAHEDDRDLNTAAKVKLKISPKGVAQIRQEFLSLRRIEPSETPFLGGPRVAFPFRDEHNVIRGVSFDDPQFWNASHKEPSNTIQINRLIVSHEQRVVAIDLTVVEACTPVRLLLAAPVNMHDDAETLATLSIKQGNRLLEISLGEVVLLSISDEGLDCRSRLSGNNVTQTCCLESHREAFGVPLSLNRKLHISRDCYGLFNAIQTAIETKKNKHAKFFGDDRKGQRAQACVLSTKMRVFSQSGARLGPAGMEFPESDTQESLEKSRRIFEMLSKGEATLDGGDKVSSLISEVKCDKINFRVLDPNLSQLWHPAHRENPLRKKLFSPNTSLGPATNHFSMGLAFGSPFLAASDSNKRSPIEAHKEGNTADQSGVTLTYNHAMKSVLKKAAQLNSRDEVPRTEDSRALEELRTIWKTHEALDGKDRASAKDSGNKAIQEFRKRMGKEIGRRILEERFKGAYLSEMKRRYGVGTFPLGFLGGLIGLIRTQIPSFGVNGIRLSNLCLGWGEKLFDALASRDIIAIRGNDVNPALKEAYLGMAKEFAQQIGLSYRFPGEHWIFPNGEAVKKTLDLSFEPAEELVLKPEEIGQFDLAGASPPYGPSVEHYSDHEAQSSRYDTLDKWKQEFLGPWIQKEWNLLKVGGVFWLNIGESANANNGGVIEFAYNCLMQRGGRYLGVFGLSMGKGMLNSQKNGKGKTNAEGVWLFQKCDLPSPS